MRNRSPQVRQARAAAKLRRAKRGYYAGRVSWRAYDAAQRLHDRWTWWGKGWPKRLRDRRLFEVTFRRRPSDDIPF